MKKVIIAILLCVSLLTVPSCSLLSKIIGGSTTEDTKETEDTEDTTKDVQPTKETSGKETGTAQNGDITVDEQVIVDQGGRIIYLRL